VRIVTNPRVGVVVKSIFYWVSRIVTNPRIGVVAKSTFYWVVKQ
jgi:hypothetical protein